MAAYPREGGFLPNQEELDFNLPTEEIYVVIRVEWGGKFLQKFVVATNAANAIERSGPTEPNDGKKLSIAAFPWEDLVARAQRFNDDWKELTRRN